MREAYPEVSPTPGLVTSKVELVLFYDAMKAIRGEQPDGPALPVDGALREDIPLSGTEGTEV